MYGNTEVRIERSVSLGGMQVYLFQRNPATKEIANACVSFSGPMSPGCAIASVAVLDDDAAQKLFDDLWNAGYRPQKNGEGGVAHVAAMKDHIADLRRLVFEEMGPALAEPRVNVKVTEGEWA